MSDPREELRALLAKRTPGSWRVEGARDARKVVAEAHDFHDLVLWADGTWYSYGLETRLEVSDADLALMILAPKLAEEVLRLQDEVERLQALVKPE